MLKKISYPFLTLILSVIGISLIAISTTVVAGSKLNFELIPMHYGLIKGEPLTKGENRGLLNFALNGNAKKGDEQLVLAGNYSLHPSELFIYKSISGIYHVAQVKETTANVVSLMNPLKEDINGGDNLWNFYNDSSHPNRTGFKAVADYALEHLKTEGLTNKIHGFVGDSWLDNGSLVPHLASRLNATNIINKGVGGRKTSDVLDEFEDDFPISANVQPDYIWVILGTNDYWDEMPRETYIDNIEEIIKKINALGAKAIVFTPSVAPLVHDANTPVGSGVFTSLFHDLSNDYADDLLDLYQRTRGEINAYIQDSNLVVELAATSPLNNDFHYLYFIDTDNDSNTGYTLPYSKWGETGVSYLVQDSSVYKSLSDDKWEWGNKRPVVSTSLNKTIISQRDLGLVLNSGKNTTIKIGVLVYSNDWNTIEDFYPKSGKMKEILIKSPSTNQVEAIKDVATTASGTSVIIDVLANDTGAGLSIGWYDDPANGSVQISNNQIVYTPNAGFLGNDEFWYEVTDSTGQSDWGNIRVTVNSVVTGFQVNNDTATVISGNTVRIDVLANDTGINLVLDEVDNVWTGSVLRTRNKLEYKSDGSYIGEVGIWYGVSDLSGDVKWAKVTIDIVP